MRLLALNASHRGDSGHTRVLLDYLMSGATEAGAVCEIVTLAKHKINHCLACDRCHTAEHHLECVHQDRDDAKEIYDKLAAADLVIYATPIYILGMASLLKVFLERMYSTSDVHEMCVTRSGLFFHHVDAAICAKPFVALICCDNMENAMSSSTLAYFRSFAKFMDAPQVGTLVRSGGRLFGHGHDPDAMERFPKIAEVYAAYRQAGRELAQNGRILPSTQRRANQDIVPVPFFGLLKRLVPFKRVMVTKAKEYFA